MPEYPDHLLGYWRGRRWLDMSRYVVHFTDTEASFVSILREGLLRPSGPHGWGRNVSEVRLNHMSACLSEVPINHIHRLMDRHGPWGIGFEKPFIREAGGGRVWYVDDETRLYSAIFEGVRDLLTTQDFASSWWKVTPFIDLVSPKRSYEFEWEREWRVPGGLSFSLADVAFVWPNSNAEELIEDIFVGHRPAWTPSGEVVGGAESNLTILGAEGDRLVEQFFDLFTDPVNELYYDDGYVWTTTCWSTHDAIDAAFPQLETQLRSALKDVLEEVSSEWVQIKEA